jgi:hypothetical protein
LSKVELFGMEELATKLGEHMSNNQPPRPGPPPGSRNQNTSTCGEEKFRKTVDAQTGGTAASMHVD